MDISPTNPIADRSDCNPRRVLVREGGRSAGSCHETEAQEEDVGCEEDQKYRHEDSDGFLYSPDIEDYKEDDEEDRDGHLVGLPVRRAIAEDGVGAGLDRNGYGQDVVHDEGAP
jgi:hypothetical protein